MIIAVVVDTIEIITKKAAEPIQWLIFISERESWRGF